MRPRHAITLAVLTNVLFTACTVGPTYKRPVVNIPDQYRGASEPSTAGSGSASVADQKWWELFQDQQLQTLIGTALEHNYDCLLYTSDAADE